MPSNPAECGPRFSYSCRGSKFPKCHSLDHKSINYPVASPKPACWALLLTNRQISAEVYDAIAALTSPSKRKRTDEEALMYKLDVMTKNQQIWPTWILFPASSQYMQCLTIELRILGGTSRRINQWSTTAPGGIFQMLFSLLNDFIHHGPGFFYKTPAPAWPCLDSITLIMKKLLTETENCNIPGVIRAARSKEWIEKSIQRSLDKIAELGILCGVVRKLKFISIDGKVIESIIKDKELNVASKLYWEGTGYYWGPNCCHKRPKS